MMMTTAVAQRILSDERLAELRAIAAVRPLTDADLPETDDLPLDLPEQRLMIELLTESLEIYWAERDDVCVIGNEFLYFSEDQVFSRDFLGPDVLVATGVPRRRRGSYVVWAEGKPPDVVIEILSPSTAANDRTEKKRLYQDVVRVPEYFWIDPLSGELAAFRLNAGVYTPILPDAFGRYWCASLSLWLVRRQARYRECDAYWLRWADTNGVLPTGREQADAERATAQAERARAEAERARAEAERARAEAAERELAAMRALLAGLQPPPDAGG